MPITKLNSSRDFFRIWFLWKTQAIAAFVIIVGLVMFYAYGSTPSYKSKAKVLLLPRVNQDLIITAGDDRGRYTLPVTEEDLNTEMELLLSDNVIHETVRSVSEKRLGLKSEERGAYEKFSGAIRGFFGGILSVLGLKDDPLSSFERDSAMLKNSLEIESVFKSNVILVNLNGEKPEQTASVLGTLLDVYVRRHSSVFSEDTGLDFYDDQAATYLQRLEDAERELQEFQRANSIVDLTDQNTANISLMSELSKELQLLEIDYDEAASRVGILSESLAAADGEVIITADMRTIPAITDLEKAIIPLVIKKTEIAKMYTDTSREYTEIVQQLEALQQELRKEVMKALETDKLELATLGAKKDSLRKNISALEAKANAFSQREIRAQELQRQVQIHKNHYLVYTSKTEDSRVNSEKKARNLANVVVVDQPSVPVRPSSPKRALLLLVSLFLGTFTAVCIPFVLETWDHKLKTVDDVESLLDMQVVSSFPEVRK